jgi:membrane protein YqaA with SNARE-associated domain
MTAYAGLFTSALLAATILPASSEVVLATLLASGAYDPSLLFITAVAGNTAGALINWTLGRFLLHFQDRRWFPLTPARYERACAWFKRYGIWSLLFSWLPVFGDPLTVVAGALRVGFWRFLILVAAGKAARYAAIVATVQWVGTG